MLNVVVPKLNGLILDMILHILSILKLISKCELKMTVLLKITTVTKTAFFKLVCLSMSHIHTNR
jgi:hypothetical protein